MKISCVMGPFFPVPPLLGGAIERIFYNLCLQFAAKGEHVTLISRRYKDLPNEEMEGGMRHLRLPSRNAGPVGLRYRWADMQYAWRASSALPPSDVTITHSVFLPLIIPKRKAGLIYASIGRFPKGQQRFYGRVDRLHAVSHAVADAIGEQTPAMIGRTVVLPYALSRQFAHQSELPLGEKRSTILYVGRLAAEKGVDLLIKTFVSNAERWPGWTLKLIGPWESSSGGDGAGYYRHLRNLTAGHDDRIDFAGSIFDEFKLIEEMVSAAIFVYPSLAEHGESFGMAPLEAMACGVPVIVSDLACFKDFLSHERDGLIFDHRVEAEASLSRALDTLVLNEGVRMDLAMAAKRRAIEFSPSRVADRYLEEFRTALAGRRGD